MARTSFLDPPCISRAPPTSPQTAACKYGADANHECPRCKQRRQNRQRRAQRRTPLLGQSSRAGDVAAAVEWNCNRTNPATPGPSRRAAGSAQLAGSRARTAASRMADLHRDHMAGGADTLTRGKPSRTTRTASSRKRRPKTRAPDAGWAPREEQTGAATSVRPLPCRCWHLAHGVVHIR
jgi:hypothetical protein